MTAEDIIALLRLDSHPEGGWYRETYRHAPVDGSRGAGTAIYYLLKAGEQSAWHRVMDADEMWHWYAGAPLELGIAEVDGTAKVQLLGTDLAADQRPQRIVPKGRWQRARSLGEWTLVGCTVSPAFVFDQFELAPPDWDPEGK